MKILLIDNYDSFTFNLFDYFKQLGAQIIVKRNDEEAVEKCIDEVDALVISPGPGIPEDAGYTNQVLETYYEQLPILGICLGHQAIGQFFGMKLIKASIPMHGITSKISRIDHKIFEDIPESFEVMRYHSLILENSSNDHLRILGKTDDDEIMMIEHKELPIIGMQFHPESILTPYGLKLLANWIRLIL